MTQPLTPVDMRRRVNTMSEDELASALKMAQDFGQNLRVLYTAAYGVGFAAAIESTLVAAGKDRDEAGRLGFKLAEIAVEKILDDEEGRKSIDDAIREVMALRPPSPDNN